MRRRPTDPTVTPSSGRSTHSKTHPLSETRGEPVDPYELSRRLEIQDRQQKERANRRVHDRHSVGPYHHTPQVAAQAFQRTATQKVHGRRETHKLSRSVIDRYRKNRDIGSRIPGATSAAQLPGDYAKSGGDSAANRNQFQWTRELENAMRVDKERNVDKGPQRDFNITFDQISSSRPHKKRTTVDRPYSTGDLDPGMKRLSLNVSAGSQRQPFERQPFDRHDWTQADERRDLKPDSQPPKERMSLSLKRIESVRSVAHKKSRDGRGTDVVTPGVDRPTQGNPRKMNFHWPLFCLGR
ncbi:MAG: hypothetical protein M1813_000210 [Trichoglossum hirsutum]|nr:MAG: hypothetical protein M1813_000210 [Trichoglossum hirsutum]